MKKFVPVLLIAITLLSAGCITSNQEQNKTNDTVTPQEDIYLEVPEAEPLGLINNSSPSFSIKFSEKVIVLNFSVDGETVALNSSDKKTFSAGLTELEEGDHSVYVKAEDKVENQAEKNFSFTVDSEPSELDINITDGKTFNKNTIDIEINSNEEIEIPGSSLSGEYLDLETDDNKTFTTTLEDLEDGDYEIRIKAVDKAGNKKKITRDLEIDTEVDETPPNKITGLTAENTGEGDSIKLSWDKSTASDFDKYKIYKSDNELNTVIGLTAIKSVASKSSTSRTISSLSEGVEYCFVVTAVDKTSNERKSDVTDACAMVNAAPEISDTEPDGTVDSSSITISFETDEDAVCKYAVDEDDDLEFDFDDDDLDDVSTDYKTSHSESHSGLSNNTEYTVYVICEDEDGLASDLETWDFDVETTDTTAPTLTVESPLNSFLSNDTVWLNVSTNETVDNCRYEFTTEEGNMNSTNSTYWYKNFSSVDNGNYTANFSCTDPAGNIGNESKSFTIDTTAPNLTVESPSNSPLSENTVWLNVSTNETVDNCRYESNISINGGITTDGNMNSVNSSYWYKEFSPVDNGSYTANFSCTDPAGNIGNESKSFTIDATTTKKGVSPSSTTNSSADVTWDTNESARSEVNYGKNGTNCDTLNNSTFDDTYVESHSISLSGLSAGTTYYFEVKSEDRAGNLAVDKNSAGNCYSFNTTTTT